VYTHEVEKALRASLLKQIVHLTKQIKTPQPKSPDLKSAAIDEGLANTIMKLLDLNLQKPTGDAVQAAADAVAGTATASSPERKKLIDLLTTALNNIYLEVTRGLANGDRERFASEKLVAVLQKITKRLSALNPEAIKRTLAAGSEQDSLDEEENDSREEDSTEEDDSGSQ
jgi:hypothetical protein